MHFVEYRYGGVVFKVHKLTKAMALVIPVNGLGEFYSVDVASAGDYIVLDNDLNLYRLDTVSAERIISHGEAVI